jgi:hypothetical protein
LSRSLDEKEFSISMTTIDLRYDVNLSRTTELPDARDGNFLFLKTAWGSDRQKMIMSVATNQLTHQPNGCKLGPKDGRFNYQGKVNALEVLWALVKPEECSDVMLIPRPICGVVNCQNLAHSSMMTQKDSMDSNRRTPIDGQMDRSQHGIRKRQLNVGHLREGDVLARLRFGSQ